MGGKIENDRKEREEERTRERERESIDVLIEWDAWR